MGFFHRSSKIENFSRLEEHSLAEEGSTTSTVPSRQRRNGLSARQIAQISPRLGVLNNIPFAIPFEGGLFGGNIHFG